LAVFDSLIAVEKAVVSVVDTERLNQEVVCASKAQIVGPEIPTTPNDAWEERAMDKIYDN
jgi:hypothetical protein